MHSFPLRLCQRKYSSPAGIDVFIDDVFSGYRDLRLGKSKGRQDICFWGSDLEILEIIAEKMRERLSSNQLGGIGVVIYPQINVTDAEITESKERRYWVNVDNFIRPANYWLRAPIPESESYFYQEEARGLVGAR